VIDVRRAYTFPNWSMAGVQIQRIINVSKGLASAVLLGRCLSFMARGPLTWFSPDRS
jgi:hypothetical protein